jgi:hypothetical protein
MREDCIQSLFAE